MTMVFWGFFFILLNFNLNVGSITIPLLPAAAGYIVLYLFVKGHGYLHNSIEKSRTLFFVLSVLSVLELAMQLTGITIDGILGALVSLVDWVLLLFAGTNLLKGISVVAGRQGLANLGSQVCNLWMAVVVLSLIANLFSWIPILPSVLLMVLLLAETVIVIIFLIQLYQLTRRMYKE